MPAGFGQEGGRSHTFREKDTGMLFEVRGPRSPSAVLEHSSEGTDELWVETGMVMRALGVTQKSFDFILMGSEEG